MTIRVFFVPIQLHIFSMTFIVMTTPFKEDFLPKLIMLKVQRLEYNESNFQNLNCSSTRQSFGNGAEFMVNGRTVEHISFHDNICYNSKREECTTDNCQCFPNNNIYIYNYENKEHTAELTLGCQMRFADNITSNIFQVITSVKINGSAMDKYEYDIKILKENKEERTTIDDKKTNSSFVDISLWLPITCGALFVVFIVLTVSIYCFRRRILRRRLLQESTKKLSERERIEYNKLVKSELTENRYFVRVMIVGKESVGKTCPLGRLLKEDISDVTSTDGVGIVVRRCKINIDDEKWTIAKEIDDDMVSRIKRALVHTNEEDRHTQNMQFSETTIDKDQHSDKKNITTETNVSLDKSVNTNETSLLVMPEDLTTDAKVILDENKDTNESASFVMSEELTTDATIRLDKSVDTNETSLLVMPEDLMSSLSTNHTDSNTSVDLAVDSSRR